jgi:hypothetical protein
MKCLRSKKRLKSPVTTTCLTESRVVRPQLCMRCSMSGVSAADLSSFAKSCSMSSLEDSTGSHVAVPLPESWTVCVVSAASYKSICIYIHVYVCIYICVYAHSYA